MAGVIIPLASTLLPVLIPEVKNLIVTIESAFAKKKPVDGQPPAGPAKAQAVAQSVRSILNGLGIPDTGQPDAASLAGFVEAVFQELKQGGGLVPTPPTPTPSYPNLQVTSAAGKPVVIIP